MDREVALRLRSAGLSYSQIGDKLGVSSSTARRWCDPEAHAKVMADNKERRKTKGKKYSKNWRDSPKGRITQALAVAKCTARKRGYAACTNSVEELLDTVVTNCQMCGKSQQENGQNLCLDHDHVTGEFRGWLCTSCNISLGHYEKIKSLANKYLRKHS